MQPKSDRTKVANRLRWAREQAGLSQGQIAHLLGVHRPTISQIESGDRNVRIEEFDQFADAYGVSREWLIDGDKALSGALDPRIQLAARELGKMKSADLQEILRLIEVLREKGGTSD